MASITRNTEGLMDQSSLSTNLLRRSALSLSDLGIHCASRTMLLTRQRLKEGPEGVKWELGLAYFSPGKMGFRSLGLGFGYWEWEESVKNGNGINIL